MSVVEDEEQAEAKHRHDVRRQRQQEQEEVAVIPPANTVIHPGAVVVKILHTVVTDGAVRAAGRPVEAAGGAPLHPHLNPTDLHRLIERSTEIILLIFIFLRSRKDAWVHEGGHAEVRQHKEEDHSIIHWNRHRELLRQPRTCKAKEERGGPHKEGSCRSDGNITAGPEWTGRGRGGGASSLTDARHHRGVGGEEGGDFCEGSTFLGRI